MHDTLPPAARGPQSQARGLLRFLTCGSVDDGKSTLIGRLLYDSGLIPEDQLRAVEQDSRTQGTTDGEIDLALLLDGLEAEREQGITIDVAYRFFSTPRRSFIVADTPGHEQYTRNMACGASAADLALLLVDARKGVVAQTRRHAVICSLLGIRQFVLAVNKLDLVGFDQGVFDAIAGEFGRFAASLGTIAVTAIPISARYGDNVTTRSDRIAWYRGPSLVEHLETVTVEDEHDGQPFRFGVQWVNRPSLDFRGFSGTVLSGRVRPGDPVVVPRSGQASRVARIVTADGDLEEAGAGDAVTLTLADEIDVSRGDLLAPPTERPVVADQFAAHLIWLGREPLLPGRSYLMRIGNQWLPATVTDLKHRLELGALGHEAAKNLALNEIGFCSLSTARPAVFDAYGDNRATGGFILVDRFTNETIAAGLIAFALRRATNIHHEDLLVDKEARAKLGHQKPAVLWFTGLSGAGKSTIAKLVEQQLHLRGRHTYMLDGDNVRQGLNRDLGFTEADRVENIRRVGEVAKLMVDAGLIVLCAFISPFRAEREMVRELMDEGEFVEIFVDTPLEECIERDPKGLYAKARTGAIKNFTGIDSPYEPPEHPEFHLHTTGEGPQQLAERLLRDLEERRLL
ncbi:MAG TPA: sulfate adenylyltransferase subunit CysN [Stellaceae bacterium]|nr:sulfate adenylyltransferase subunit CysN [Stellaceae bacterium]